MVELKLGNVESQFADIIWNHEPIPSGELVKICERVGVEKINYVYNA